MYTLGTIYERTPTDDDNTVQFIYTGVGYNQDFIAIRNNCTVESEVIGTFLEGEIRIKKQVLINH